MRALLNIMPMQYKPIFCEDISIRCFASTTRKNIDSLGPKKKSYVIQMIRQDEPIIQLRI